eukprot:gnl/MRDRNA2_/MRDRNA2_128335_c0_seq1.p1 gnl/MRDRNA2_/MRDRNA2_128335_c0~~gnl/MRDRNA2_/MRDRNA2_128335_c0_seq1.p1  ORF type:complete len:491 (+),score=116.20 gnl/MRDRNA2_/MRDRNA2_128335_c0_seq1:139-1611(+)
MVMQKNGAQRGGTRRKGPVAMLRGVGASTFASSFQKKNIPLEAPEEVSDDEPNFTWLAEGKGNSHRWDRHHLGLTEYQSTAIGMANQHARPAQLKAKILRRILRPLGDDESVGPLEPMKSKDFPPMQPRATKPSTGSHYAFFDKICPINSSRRQYKEQEIKLKRLETWRRKDQAKYEAPNIDESMRGDESPDASFFLTETLTPSNKARSHGDVMSHKSGPASPRSKAAPRSPPASPKAKASPKHTPKQLKNPPQLSMSQKLPPHKRQACEAIRMAIFGDACWQGKDAPKTDKEKLKIFEESRGSEKDVIRMWQCWKELDEDDSGDCDIREFLHYFRHKGLPYVAERAIKGAFGDQNAGKAFQFEQLMGMIWPRCGPEDVEWMKMVIENYKLIGHQETGAAMDLPDEMYVELIETFNWIDADGGGSCSVKELLDCELFPTKEKALDTMAKFDLGEDDELSLEQFLEVMCPVGYQIPKKDHGRMVNFAKTAD